MPDLQEMQDEVLELMNQSAVNACQAASEYRNMRECDLPNPDDTDAERLSKRRCDSKSALDVCK